MLPQNAKSHNKTARHFKPQNIFSVTLTLVRRRHDLTLTRRTLMQKTALELGGADLSTRGRVINTTIALIKLEEAEAEAARGCYADNKPIAPPCFDDSVRDFGPCAVSDMRIEELAATAAAPSEAAPVEAPMPTDIDTAGDCLHDDALAVNSLLSGAASYDKSADTISLTVTALGIPVTSTLTKAAAQLSFAEFKTRWDKVYASTKEEAQRFDIFVRNVEHLMERKAGMTETQRAVFGITKFFDQTPEEFSRSHLNYKPVAAAPLAPVRNATARRSGATSINWAATAEPASPPAPAMADNSPLRAIDVIHADNRHPEEIEARDGRRWGFAVADDEIEGRDGGLWDFFVADDDSELDEEEKKAVRQDSCMAPAEPAPPPAPAMADKRRAIDVFHVNDDNRHHPEEEIEGCECGRWDFVAGDDFEELDDEEEEALRQDSCVAPAEPAPPPAPAMADKRRAIDVFHVNDDNRHHPEEEIEGCECGRWDFVAGDDFEELDDEEEEALRQDSCVAPWDSGEASAAAATAAVGRRPQLRRMIGGDFGDERSVYTDVMTRQEEPPSPPAPVDASATGHTYEDMTKSPPPHLRCVISRLSSLSPFLRCTATSLPFFFCRQRSAVEAGSGRALREAVIQLFGV